MSERFYKILIVDDDPDSCESISEILKAKGYQTRKALNGSEAIERAKIESFDLFLLDLKLPDIEGTQLLDFFQKTAPETPKIMITGYPSWENAAESLNLGADSYLTKPFNPDKLLEEARRKLQEREQKQRIDRDRLKEWVTQRIRQTQADKYEEFAERTAQEFGIFGLNKTRAKIYVAANVLGVSSASEIALLSKIRREEVYRIIPELEKCGLLTRRIGTPQRFAVIEPKRALQILFKTRIRGLKKEVAALRQKKAELISMLGSTSFKLDEENLIEVLSQKRNVQDRLMRLIENAEKSILAASSFEGMTRLLFESISSCVTANQWRKLELRVIIDEFEFEEGVDESNSALSSLFAFRSELVNARQVKKLPFNLLMVDGAEAIWGDFQQANSGKVLWTNDLTQINILIKAFENLWNDAHEFRFNFKESL